MGVGALAGELVGLLYLQAGAVGEGLRERCKVKLSEPLRHRCSSCG